MKTTPHNGSDPDRLELIEELERDLEKVMAPACDLQDRLHELEGDLELFRSKVEQVLSDCPAELRTGTKNVRSFIDLSSQSLYNLRAEVVLLASGAGLGKAADAFRKYDAG